MTHCLDALWLLILVKTPSFPTSACQSGAMTDNHSHTHHNEGEILERERESVEEGVKCKERVLETILCHFVFRKNVTVGKLVSGDRK